MSFIEIPDAQDLERVRHEQLRLAADHRSAGIAAYRSGDRAEAAAAFLRALVAFPGDVESLYHIALIAEAEQPQSNRAKACYCAVLALDPEHTGANLRLRAYMAGEA